MQKLKSVLSRVPPRALTGLAALAAGLCLSGCQMVVMNPTGDLAIAERDLIVVSTLLMLIIIVPVIALTLFFAWKYRKSNTDATYDPNFYHSTKLEYVIWGAPLAIIIVLGVITWISTHELDPYRPLEHDAKPVTVEVVAMDWKWLFIYPEYGVASVNELAVPVGRPVNFKLTASTIMNSFYVPDLAGMIYAMPGMETKLHAIANTESTSQGLSSNYSGEGFSHMRFTYRAVKEADFDAWVAQAKTGQTLDRAAYLALEKPSERVPVSHYRLAEPELFAAITNLCVDPGKMCMNEMMHVDMTGGGGHDGLHDKAALEYDVHKAHGAHPLKNISEHAVEGEGPGKVNPENIRDHAEDHTPGVAPAQQHQH